jgi:hypothetical protein
MLSMVRQAALVLTLALLSLGSFGCAGRPAPNDATARPPGFATDEQKLLACLDLRDHVVQLYADEYVEQQGLAMTETELAAFRDGWGQELAKRGTFSHFEQSCFMGLTPRKYHCGMASQTADGLVACMKLSSR